MVDQRMLSEEAQAPDPMLAPRRTRRGPPGMGGGAPRIAPPPRTMGPSVRPEAPAPQARAPKKMGFFEKGFDNYRKAPTALKVAHAVVNPWTGIPMALAAHRGAVKRGLNKFGNGIRNFGRKAVGGIANAFKWGK